MRNLTDKILGRHLISFVSEDKDLSKKLWTVFKRIGHNIDLIESLDSVEPEDLRAELIIVDSALLLSKRSEIIKKIKSAASGFSVVASICDYATIKDDIELLSHSDGFIDLREISSESVQKIVQRFLDPQKTGEKTRVYTREKMKSRVHWQTHGSTIRRNSEIMNICKGGIFIKEPNITIHRRDVVKFSIECEGEADDIRGLGIVRWISTPGMRPLETGFGLEFFSIDGFA